SKFGRPPALFRSRSASHARHAAGPPPGSEVTAIQRSEGTRARKAFSVPAQGFAIDVQEPCVRTQA
ncbi:MAG: hypothetical protein ACKVXR_03355, partial [Planctomycetota bacterium]